MDDKFNLRRHGEQELYTWIVNNEGQYLSFVNSTNIGEDFDRFVSNTVDAYYVYTDDQLDFLKQAFDEEVETNNE